MVFRRAPVATGTEQLQLEHPSPGLGAQGARAAAVSRLILLLASLVTILMIGCVGLGYLLASDADDRLETEHRRAVHAALEDLRSELPDFTSVTEAHIARLERATGVTGLRLDSEATRGDRNVQSLVDQSGRLIGWASWTRDRPATLTVVTLLPFMSIATMGILGLAGLSLWQVRLSRGPSERDHGEAATPVEQDRLTGLPNQYRFRQRLDEMLAARAAAETLVFAFLDIDRLEEVNYETRPQGRRSASHGRGPTPARRVDAGSADRTFGR